MTTTSPPSLNVEVANLNDLSTLARIHVAAFNNDPCVQIMLPEPAKHMEMVVGMLAKQISDPSWLVMKAEEPHTGSIKGWASWLRSGYEDTREKDKTQRPVRDGSVAPKSEPFQDLGSYIAAHQDHILGEWMSGKQCLKLNSLFTDPHFQRKGIGTMLLCWGADLADNDRVPCYLASTPSAYGLYCANAFRPRGWLDIDLKEWGSGGNDGYRGWGNYRLWFMERLPRHLTPPQV